MSILNSNKNFYNDIDLSMIPHPLSKDLNKRTDSDAVKRSLLHLFLLEPYDVPFESDIHGVGRNFLFSQDDAFMINTIESRVKWLIESFEPRVKLTDIKTNRDPSGSHIDVTVSFIISAIKLEDSLTYSIQRIR